MPDKPKLCQFSILRKVPAPEIANINHRGLIVDNKEAKEMAKTTGVTIVGHIIYKVWELVAYSQPDLPS